MAASVAIGDVSELLFPALKRSCRFFNFSAFSILFNTVDTHVPKRSARFLSTSSETAVPSVDNFPEFSLFFSFSEFLFIPKRSARTCFNTSPVGVAPNFLARNSRRSLAVNCVTFTVPLSLSDSESVFESILAIFVSVNCELDELFWSMSSLTIISVMALRLRIIFLWGTASAMIEVVASVFWTFDVKLIDFNSVGDFKIMSSSCVDEFNSDASSSNSSS